MRAHVRAAATDGDLHPAGTPYLAPRQGFSHPAFAAAGAVLASSAQPLVLWWQRGILQHSEGPRAAGNAGGNGYGCGHGSLPQCPPAFTGPLLRAAWA